jgi:hypothetical protein
LVKGVELSDVKESKVFLFVASDKTIGTDFQIEVHNRETLGHLFQQREDGWPEDVNAREGKASVTYTTFHLSRLYVRPALEAQVVVEKQITLGLALAHKEKSIGDSGSTLQLCWLATRGTQELSTLNSPLSTKITQNIDIMYEDGR